MALSEDQAMKHCDMLQHPYLYFVTLTDTSELLDFVSVLNAATEPTERVNLLLKPDLYAMQVFNKVNIIRSTVGLPPIENKEMHLFWPGYYVDQLGSYIKGPSCYINAGVCANINQLCGAAVFEVLDNNVRLHYMEITGSIHDHPVPKGDCTYTTSIAQIITSLTVNYCTNELMYRQRLEHDPGVDLVKRVYALSL